MSLRWLLLLHLPSLVILRTEHTIKGFRTGRLTTLGNQRAYTKPHDGRSSTKGSGKLVNANGAARQLIVTEEYGSGAGRLQNETTFKSYASESITFPSFNDQTNLTGGKLHPMTDHSSAPDAYDDMCTIKGFKQHCFESENQTNSNATTCRCGCTSFEGELVSSGLVATVRFVIQDVLTPTIAFPGCVFNIISIYVLEKRGTEFSSTRYLIVLGVADLCYLISTLLSWILVLLKEYHYVFYVSTRLFLIYASLQFYFLLLTGRYSNLLVLLLSLDRFIAVKFPLRAKTSPLSRHPLKLSLALFVFLTVLLIPNFFRVEFFHMTHFDANESQIVFKNASISHSNTLFFTIHSFTSVVTFRLLPVLFTSVLNIAIILEMKLSNGSRVTTHMTDEKRQERELKITRMLVTISLIFLICVTPGLLHVIIFNFYPAYTPFGPYRNIYLILSDMVPILDAINSTVNFFVYVLLSERFRVVFLNAFCPCISRVTTMQTVAEQISN